MKFDKTIIEFVKRAIKTTSSVKINSIIIERDTIRAMSEEKTVILLHKFEDSEIELPFDVLAINRIDVFLQRFAVVESLPNFSIDATVIEDKVSKMFMVSELKMKADGVKVDFRCANIKAVVAPKQITDTMKFVATLSDTTVPLLGKGISAMNCDDSNLVTISSNESGILFEITDTNNDTFSYTVPNRVRDLSGNNNTAFAFRYPAKLLYQLLNQATTEEFIVGVKGMLKVEINGMNVYVLPQF